MKQRNILAVILLLIIAAIACNAGAIQTVEVTRVVPQTVVVTEDIQEGGFTTGTPVDVTTLPALQEIGGGGAPMPCLAENTQPSISWGYSIFPIGSLCLNNFPIAPDSPGLTVTLTDPMGRAFSENFTYSQAGIVNARGVQAGFIEDGSGIDGLPGTPAVNLEVYMPASFPCGDWQVSASTQDGSVNVASTTLNTDCQYPRLSALPDLNVNPFLSPAYSWEGPAFANNETIYIVGTGYPPNLAITIALYLDDPSAGKSPNGRPLGTAKYAVSLLTDSSGNFQAPFIVGSGTPRGAYYAIAASEITSNIMLDVFGARFSIK